MGRFAFAIIFHLGERSLKQCVSSVGRISSEGNKNDFRLFHCSANKASGGTKAGVSAQGGGKGSLPPRQHTPPLECLESPRADEASLPPPAPARCTAT